MIRLVTGFVVFGTSANDLHSSLRDGRSTHSASHFTALVCAILQSWGYD